MIQYMYICIHLSLLSSMVDWIYKPTSTTGGTTLRGKQDMNVSPWKWKLEKLPFFGTNSSLNVCRQCYREIKAIRHQKAMVYSIGYYSNTALECDKPFVRHLSRKIPQVCRTQNTGPSQKNRNIGNLEILEDTLSITS